MKRLAAVIICAVLLVGCSQNSSSQTKKNDVQTDSGYNVSAPQIEVCSLSNEQIKSTLDAQQNFKAAQDIIINIPSKAPVLEFDTKTACIPDWEQDFDTLYARFKVAFAYLFPNKPFNEDCLYYHGKGSEEKWDEQGEQTAFLRRVKNDMQKLKNSQGGSVFLEYDEGYGKDEKTGSAMLNFGPDPEMNCIGMMSRRTAQLDKSEVEGVYSPDSERSFSLSGEQVSVKDAVEFFESYIDKAPYPKNRNCKVKVSAVEVRKLGEKYAFHFLLSREINGIRTESRSTLENYTSDNKYYQHTSEGYMIKKGEVESFQDCTPNVIIENAKGYNSIVSFESAVKRISGELTGEVTFEVRAAELVYAQKPIKTKDGYIDTNGYPMNVLPVWKLTLYNPNDMYTYYCYLTADGEDFSYCAGR